MTGSWIGALTPKPRRLWMDTRYEDTARKAVSQARYRLRSAKYHSTFPPYVPARVIGELVLAREELVAAQDAVSPMDRPTHRPAGDPRLLG